jgi:hypothetical protein
LTPRLPGHALVLWREHDTNFGRRTNCANEHTAATVMSLFVGDLSPVGIAIYASLVSGGVDRASGEKPIDADYVGLRDEMLALCAATFKGLRGKEIRLETLSFPETLCVSMTATEREILTILENSRIDLERLIGRNSLLLLRRGSTVDLHTVTRHEC